MSVDPLDELAVRRLHDRYAAACDADDPDRVASLFAADGVLVVRGAEYRGPEIVAFYRKGLDVPSLHFTTGLVVASRPDGLLDATCGFVAIEMPDGVWRGVAGRYADTVRVADGAAEFVRREIVPTGRSDG